MRDDGRIEEGRRFQGILARKEGPDEERAFPRQGPVREEVGHHLVEAGQQGGLDVQVPGLEVLQHRGQVAPGLGLAQGQGAAEDGGDAVDATGDEGPEDDPGALRDELNLVVTKAKGTHQENRRGGAMGCSAKVISARERWKARVDSAPWFSLTRSAWRPSLQPPLLES